jgi:hypothetical protein
MIAGKAGRLCHLCYYPCELFARSSSESPAEAFSCLDTGLAGNFSGAFVRIAVGGNGIV